MAQTCYTAPMIPKLVLIPLLVGFITQFSKFTWQSRSGRINWAALNTYGGMPSTHTAVTVSLVTTIGLHEGITSAAFALALIFTLIVIRDAIGFRQYLGAHSRALNTIVQEFPEEEQAKFKPFRERIGHTPLEATVGGFIGVLLGYVLYAIFP